MKCVIYARVSSREQERDGFSIDAQLKLLRCYAREHSYQIVREFKEAETAKVSGRRQFNIMLEYIRSNLDITNILCEKTDRLSRNFRDIATLDDLMQSHNLTIHYPKEGITLHKDSKSHEKFIFGIKALMAKNYVDNLSEEVKKGMLEKAEQGDYLFRAPLGYKNNLQTRKIEIDPVTAPLLKKLFEWYATGRYSLKGVGVKAYSEGIGFNKPGRKFCAGTVARILQNPVYYGKFRFKGRLMDGNHEPLITKELFDAVQSQMGRLNRPKERKRSFAFRGLLKCGYCGCSMTAQIQQEKYIYYSCTGGRGKCPQKYYREEKVAEMLGGAIRNITLPESLVGWIREALREVHSDEQRFHQDAISSLRKELGKVESRISKIYEDKLDGVISQSDWVRFNEKYSADITKIKQDLNRHLQSGMDYYLTGSKILELAKTAYSQYVSQSIEEKRRLLDFVVYNFKVKDGKFIPEYRQPFDLLAVYKRKETVEKQKTGEVLPVHQLWRG